MRGGIAHYVALLYKKLSERGHDVHVLSFKRQYPSLLFPGKTQADEGEELIPVDSMPLLDSINPFSWIRAFFWIKKIKPDVLLYKYWMPFFAPCFATLSFLSKKFLKTKIVYVCDNIVPHEKKIGDRLLTKIGLKYVDGFVVQSKSVLRDLLSFRPDAVYRESPHPVYEIFPPAVTKNQARKHLKIQDEKVILYFGYIRKYKGLNSLIEAMPKILKLIQVHLLVCGEFYEGRKETYDLIDSLKLKNDITVCDAFIPNEEVVHYFCAADLVVLPYISATQSGIVQIAYHYDKPVVVTDVGGLPEVVHNGKTGFVIPPRDSEAIADAVVNYYEKGKEETFTKNVHLEKKKYTWDNMIDTIESLI